MQDVSQVAVGLVLVLLAATGATATQRTLEQQGRGRHVPLALVPFGILLGAGASLARGWDLWASIAVGGVLVPGVGVAGRWREVRRRRRGAT